MRVKEIRGLALGSLQVFGLNFLQLGKIIKNPPVRHSQTSPFVKGGLLERRDKEKSTHLS